MSRLFLALLAAGLTLALAPTAAASDSDIGDIASLCDYDGNAVERAYCAVRDTAGNIIGIADPVVDFAKDEAAWAGYQTCEIAEHVVGPTCAAIVSTTTA